MKYSLVIIISFLGIGRAFSQPEGFNSDGKDFYLGFVLPSFNNNQGELVDGDFRQETRLNSLHAMLLLCPDFLGKRSF